jgi:hypothetical protein
MLTALLAYLQTNLRRGVSVLFLIVAVQSTAQPPVYLNFLSHNEETISWNNSTYYVNNRGRLVSLADYFQANGITWNLQSDWVYLTNVLSQETSALMSTTNNKNILRWLYEDKGVEIDPHAHESEYIYPDVVKLMDSVGLPESKVIGGTIYNDSNGINIWTNLVNGHYGVIFPDRFWIPDYMMGGGTPNHVADLKYFGFWNPKDTANYLVHDTTSRLRHIGVGCSIKIKDTSQVVNVVNDIKDVIQKVQSGQYPSDGFYVQTIFFEQGDLNSNLFYNKLLQIADSANAIVATGAAQWKTLKQSYTLWETVYNAEMFQWECGDVSAGIDDNLVETAFSIYPNPSSGVINLFIDHSHSLERVELNVYNVLGDLIKTIPVSSNSTQVQLGCFSDGLYHCMLLHGNKVLLSETVIIQK